MLADLSLPQLHEQVQEMAPPSDTGSVAHDVFYRLLETYKSTDTPTRLHALATTCNARIIREAMTLPLDLLAAYGRLASLARWRARQIEENVDVRW
jgi:hypothetical protein